MADHGRVDVGLVLDAATSDDTQERDLIPEHLGQGLRRNWPFC